eukprot:491919-Hanusia_phi.AAC.1
MREGSSSPILTASRCSIKSHSTQLDREKREGGMGSTEVVVGEHWGLEEGEDDRPESLPLLRWRCRSGSATSHFLGEDER